MSTPKCSECSAARLTMLLKNCPHRATAWATLQPDHNLLLRSRVLGREEPEKEPIGAFGVLIYRQGARVGFSNVKFDFRYLVALHSEF